MKNDKAQIAERIGRQRSTKVFGQGLASTHVLKVVTRRGSSTARIPKVPGHAFQGHTGGNMMAPELMGHVTIPYNWKEFVFH